MSSPQERKLAQELNDLKRRMDRSEKGRRPTQLDHTSLENSRVNVYDDTGVLRQRWGRQADGTFTTVDSSGPAPPQPTSPTVSALGAAVLVSWDGEFLNAQRPEDFRNIEVHGSPTTGYTPDSSTKRNTLWDTDGDGGEVAIETDETLYIRLIAVSTSGSRSNATPEVEAVPGPVVADDVVDGIIDDLALADGAVTNAKIAADAVDGTKITDDSIESPHIVAGAIQTSELAADSVSAGKIVSGAITTGKLDALAVTADKIDSNAITTGKINAGAITTAKLDAQAVTTDKLAAGSVTADKLEAEMVLTNRLISGNPSGARTELSGTGGLESFNSLGDQTVRISNTGNARIVGEFATDQEQNSRIVINPVTGVLNLSGHTDSNASTPDSPQFDIPNVDTLSGITIIMKVAMDDWTPGSFQSFIGRGGGGSDKSFAFFITSSNLLQLQWSEDGSPTGSTHHELDATEATGFANGTIHWIAVTLQFDNGSSGHTVRFYTSEDGELWTLLGNEVTGSGTTSIHNGDASLVVGNRGDGSNGLIGSVYQVQVYDGVKILLGRGSLIADPDFEMESPGTISFDDSTGLTWTVDSEAEIGESATPTIMRLYPLDGDDSLFGELRVDASSQETAVTSMRSATTRSDGGYGVWSSSENHAGMSYSLSDDDPPQPSTLFTYEDHVLAQSGHLRIYLDDRVEAVNPGIDGDTRIAIIHKDTSGSDIANSALQFKRSTPDNDRPWIATPIGDSGLLFGNGSLYVGTGSGSDFQDGPIQASEYNTPSGSGSKKDIAELSFDARSVVDGAHVYEWRYNHEGENSTKHVGPMAEDLPSHVANADNAVDLRSMIGVLWQAVQQLSSEVKGLS